MDDTRYRGCGPLPEAHRQAQRDSRVVGSGSFADAVNRTSRVPAARGFQQRSPEYLELFSRDRGSYTCIMRTRSILVVVSALSVAATLIAVTQGAWVYALALYGMSVAGLVVLLRSAVSKHRTQIDQPSRTASDEAAPGSAAPPSPHS